MTATRSPLLNRGYEPERAPSDSQCTTSIDPEGVAHAMCGGTPIPELCSPAPALLACYQRDARTRSLSECLLCSSALYPRVLTTFVPSVNERRRFQRLVPTAILLQKIKVIQVSQAHDIPFSKHPAKHSPPFKGRGRGGVCNSSIRGHLWRDNRYRDNTDPTPPLQGKCKSTLLTISI